MAKSSFKSAVLFLVIFAASLNFNDTCVAGQRITGDLPSTLRIVMRLCFHPRFHNRNTVINFFGCYDWAPGKQQFVTCQQRILGNVLNTIPRVDAVCKNTGNPQTLTNYAGCLQREFQWAGINMQEAVTKVNVCQGRVLGL